MLPFPWYIGLSRLLRSRKFHTAIGSAIFTALTSFGLTAGGVSETVIVTVVGSIGAVAAALIASIAYEDTHSGVKIGTLMPKEDDT